MSELHITTDAVKFIFEDKVFTLPHISDRNVYKQDEFKDLGFELYTRKTRDSWTNELVLILNDNNHNITKITNEQDYQGYKEEIAIFSDDVTVENNKIDLTLFKVLYPTKASQESTLKFYGAL